MNVALTVALIVGALALAGVLAAQIALLRRKPPVDPGALQQLLAAVERGQDRAERGLREEIARTRAETTQALGQSRLELATAMNESSAGLVRSVGEMARLQQEQLELFSARLGQLADAGRQAQEQLRATVEHKLAAIQEQNARQLEQMRQTVDEKLQGTLEKRLGESFRQVGERLEQVARGLGEMQVLATGVGDLKKVLSNVKTRGTWGEVQLGAMLEQVLAPDQFARNVATRDGGERVEFAVRLPGREAGPDAAVWLPIDAKYPLEDYQRLIEAQERSDAGACEAAARQLEGRIRLEAAQIRDKYLNPPRTTDFAVLFLPTEGLFAEVLRRPGLADSLQRDCRVLVAGPTTLWSLLNSLQMGFRTLAIQQRSGEVWALLAAVKTEWARYSELLGKVQRKLGEASHAIEDAERRTRVIGRKLTAVHELPAPEAQALLELEGGPPTEPG